MMRHMETFDRVVLQTIGLVAALIGTELLFKSLFASTTWAEVLWSGIGGIALLTLSLVLYRRTRGLPAAPPIDHSGP